MIYKLSYCHVIFYLPTLNIISLAKKIIIFWRFCLCIFESATVKSNCPVQIFKKMINFLKIILIQTVGLPY